MRIFTRCLFLFLFFGTTAFAQTVWPAPTWTNAVNLTSVMDAAGVNDLSGLHFNPTNNRLYAVQGDGRLRVLTWNTTTNSFSQFASKSLPGGPEGITQANLAANEFYVIDENNYEIRRYAHNSSFSSITLVRQWNLLASPSPMEDTGNSGPEGIVFVPDASLSAIGFRSQQTGQLYTSTKGLGGLFFIAHQDQGYVWVFDLNPNADDDFLYVGKYRTNQTESCDLSFDRSTGMLYILHNVTGNNTIEVTDLSSAPLSGGTRKLTTINEFSVTNPNDGNENIEGFALTPKCTSSNGVSVWLCRDVETNEADAILQDCLRWFTPFAAEGNCTPLANHDFNTANGLTLYPNPVSTTLNISGSRIIGAEISIYNNLGQLLYKKQNQSDETLVLDVTAFDRGVYFLQAVQNGQTITLKFCRQ